MNASKQLASLYIRRGQAQAIIVLNSENPAFRDYAEQELIEIEREIAELTARPRLMAA